MRAGGRHEIISIPRFSQNDAKRYKELCQRFVTEMGPVMMEFM
jgi:hypothetical protein